MNAIDSPRVYMRSIATRRSHTEIPEAMGEVLDVVKAAGYDLVIAETAGIGQGDSHIIDLVDLSMYVMTSDFGAASQLEKIDMLDFADLVVVNKFEKRGGEDAVRDVRKQVQRNRMVFDRPPETCRCSVPLLPSSTMTASPPSTTPCWTPSKTRPAWPSNPACRGPTPSSPPPKPSSSRRNAPATWRKSPKR
jgi:hypothetical protein